MLDTPPAAALADGDYFFVCGLRLDFDDKDIQLAHLLIDDADMHCADRKPMELAILIRSEFLLQAIQVRQERLEFDFPSLNIGRGDRREQGGCTVSTYCAQWLIASSG